MKKYLTEEFRELMSIQKEIVGNHSKCSGMGWKLDEKGYPETCECSKVFSYIKELRHGDIPRVYWAFYWRELEIEQHYKVFIQMYLKNLPNAVSQALGVLYLGPNGVGKTAMMCEIGKEAITRGYGVYYTTTQRYINLLMRARDREAPLPSLTSDTKIVLLDEIDKAYIKEGSDYVPKAFEEFIRSTISSGKVVIAATNETEEGLESLFGQSTLSMVRRYLKLVPVDGEDFSDRRQDNWDKALTDHIDWFHPNIVRMAEQMYKNRSDK